MGVKTINVIQDQWDERLLSCHKHITASSDALEALDKALIKANEARNFLYNAVMKNGGEDSYELVGILEREAKDMNKRLKEKEERENISDRA